MPLVISILDIYISHESLYLFFVVEIFSTSRNFLIIFTTKTAHYVSVYKAVLTLFMLYVYDQNIDTILKRRQVKKAIVNIAATQAK